MPVSVVAVDFLYRPCYIDLSPGGLKYKRFRVTFICFEHEMKVQVLPGMAEEVRKPAMPAWLTKTVAALLILVCLCGIGTSIGVNAVNRSLWLDEAMLADSFSNRTLANLWDGAFDNKQIAPLGWLYFEKLLTVIFGNTEFVLRLGSLLAYALTIGLLYYIVRKMLHAPLILSLAAAALFANLPYTLEYSNVFKQYISEGLYVLIALIAFDKYRKGRISTWALCLIWVAAVWFSNPVCFIEGGCLIVEGVCALKEKDGKKLLRIVIIGACILASFLIHYFFWIHQASVVDAMQSDWASDAFLLFPHTRGQLFSEAKMIHSVYIPFDRAEIPMLILTGITILLAFVQHKNHVLLWIIGGCVVALLASSFNFFPMAPRVWFFFIPTMIVFCFGGIADLTEVIRKKGWNRILITVVSTVLPVVLALMVAGMINYWKDPESAYWQGEETNDQVDWLRENLQSGEDAYVYILAGFGFKYRNGYNNNSIGRYKDNLIYGNMCFTEEDDCETELKTILDHDSIYIATSHLLDAETRLKRLLEGIRREGYLQMVLYKHSTPLFWYCRSLEDGKIRAAWEVFGSENGEGIRTTGIRIHNTGTAYINHFFERVCLTNRSRDFSVELPGLISPGTTVEVWVPREITDDTELLLVNDEGPVCTEEQFTALQ